MKSSPLRLRLGAALTLLCIAPCAFAAPASTSASASGAALTIYNQNFAVVRDTIPLDLNAGNNDIRYTGITAQLEPDSVILRDPTGKSALRIVEQNYRGDTVSQGLLLSLNEGKTIDFQVPGVNGGAPTIVQGKILRSGYNPGAQSINPYQPYGYNSNQPDNQPLIEVDGKLQFGLPGTPLFPPLADDSVLTPTLEWTVDSDKAGPVNAELAYITEGMSWKAAYNVVAPETGNNLDITAWVTIDNESGKDFDDAHIKLMAGNVSKIQNPDVREYARQTFADSLSSSTPTVTQKAFDEYHLYTLANPTTLRNHETKQVQLLRAPKVASQEIYVYDGLKLDPNQYNGWNYQNIRNTNDYGTQSNTKVAVEREFVNSEANGLGVPLPAGRVRFYRRDDDGQLEFIGEDNIDHTPKDETVKIVTGDSFDLIGSRTQTSYHVDQQNDNADESFSITLKNHKTTPVEIRVIEHLYRGDNWTITAHSDTFLKTEAHTMEFRVQVPASGAKTVTYSVHYTW